MLIVIQKHNHHLIVTDKYKAVSKRAYLRGYHQLLLISGITVNILNKIIEKRFIGTT
jgi:hypothetical protein